MLVLLLLLLLVLVLLLLVAVTAAAAAAVAVAAVICSTPDLNTYAECDRTRACLDTIQLILV